MKPRRAEFLIMQPHPVQRGFELMSMQIHCGPKTKVPHIRSKPFAGLQTHDRDTRMLHICLLLFLRCKKKQKKLHTPMLQTRIRLTLHPGVGRHNNSLIKAYGGIIVRNSGALGGPLNFPRSRARVRRRKEE